MQSLTFRRYHVFYEVGPDRPTLLCVLSSQAFLAAVRLRCVGVCCVVLPRGVLRVLRQGAGFGIRVGMWRGVGVGGYALGVRVIGGVLVGFSATAGRWFLAAFAPNCVSSRHGLHNH